MLEATEDWDIMLQNVSFGPLLGYQPDHTATDMYGMETNFRYSASDYLKPQSMLEEAKAGPPV